jgi:hypothetical protein
MRTKHGQATGISGESSLWRFYHLYRFDPSLDLVYDVMHLGRLNIFKTYIQKLCAWIGEDVEKRKKVQKMCDVVEQTRPRELKGGRWPSNPFEYHHLYTSEENQKIVQWILPSILYSLNEDGNMDSNLYKMGLCLIDIAYYVFNETRRKGWTTTDFRNVKLLFQTWQVLSEDRDGPKPRPLEHAVGTGHVLEDVQRFGPPDVY